MKYPECFKECDSIDLNLKDPQGKFEIKLAQISGVWASALLTLGNLNQNELLQISRSFRRSEYSKTSVKITFINPYCLCRIYPNGKICVMGSLNEKQAYKTVAKVVRKIKYKTKWKVIIPPSSKNTIDIIDNNINMINNMNKHNENKIKLDGNGLLWKYVENETIFRVSECLKTFRIDQLYCRIILNNSINLYDIYDKIAEKKINVNMFRGYLRVQFNLNRPNVYIFNNNSNSLNSNYYNNDNYTNTVNERERYERDKDIENELENALENEIFAKRSSCLIFRRGVINLLGCINRQEILDSFNQLMSII